METLSIIIPVFNDYVKFRNCIMSFSNQTNYDFEVVVIDDSTDINSSVSIENLLRESKLNYKLIKNKSNMGPGVSRNLGIEASSGKYITFVDGDDLVSIMFVEKIVSIINELSIDVLIFDLCMIIESKKKIINGLPIKKSGFINNKFASVYAFGGSVCKVYLKSIINKYNIRFLDQRRNEDMPFARVSMFMSTKIYYLKEPLYIYLRHSNSLMNDRNLLDPKNAFNAFNYIQDKVVNLSVYNELEAIFIKELLYSTTLTIAKMTNNRDVLMKHITDLEKQFPKWSRNSYIKLFKIHIRLTLFAIKHKIYWLIYLISRKRG